MWKDDRNHVNKRLGLGYKNGFRLEPVRLSSTYPQVDDKVLVKNGLLGTHKNYTHIHTPNSSNNFSI